MKKIRNILATGLLLFITLGVSSCTAPEIPEPDHKARTTACLIRSTVLVPGSPENQLAADLGSMRRGNTPWRRYATRTSSNVSARHSLAILCRFCQDRLRL